MKVAIFVASHSHNPGVFATEADAQKFVAESAPGTLAITRHEIEIASNGDPDYLARFPEAARPYCDRAYQDGFEDGHNDAEVAAFIRFEFGQEDRIGEPMGPYPFVQATYDSIRVGPDGDQFIANFIDGLWVTEDGQKWSDFVMFAEDGKADREAIDDALETAARVVEDMGAYKRDVDGFRVEVAEPELVDPVAAAAAVRALKGGGR